MFVIVVLGVLSGQRPAMSAPVCSGMLGTLT